MGLTAAVLARVCLESDIKAKLSAVGGRVPLSELGREGAERCHVVSELPSCPQTSCTPVFTKHDGRH